jgi:hypothetical protein
LRGTDRQGALAPFSTFRDSLSVRIAKKHAQRRSLTTSIEFSKSAVVSMMVCLIAVTDLPAPPAAQELPHHRNTTAMRFASVHERSVVENTNNVLTCHESSHLLLRDPSHGSQPTELHHDTPHDHTRKSGMMYRASISTKTQSPICWPMRLALRTHKNRRAPLPAKPPPSPNHQTQKRSESFLISQTGNRTPASGGLSDDKPKY